MKPQGQQQQWQRVGSCVAVNEGGKTGGSRMSSSSLSPYAGGDLQNNRKHNSCWWLVCAKESWSMETRGTTLWCVAGGWSMGIVKGQLKKEDLLATRSLVRAALGRRKREKRENVGFGACGGEREVCIDGGMWDEEGGLIEERDGEMAPRECGAPSDGALMYGDKRPEYEPAPPYLKPPKVEKPFPEHKPPVYKPPKIEKPPVYKPPKIEKPPVYNPPKIEKPPVYNPPKIEKPPVYKPPKIEKPPVYKPPKIEKPPVYKPPKIEKPPVYKPPVIVKPPPFHKPLPPYGHYPGHPPVENAEYIKPKN
nr:pollen-specific leucine-rich repeat extensin-like protein 4 [Populus alba]